MKEYKILRFRRGEDGESEDKTEEEICKALNQLAKEGWRVVQDLNPKPYCHKFLLEREAK